MGNRSAAPTKEDYKAYVDDLLELQKFLNEKFVAGHLRSSVRDGEFDAEYLEALKIKLCQLQKVRRLVRSRWRRRAGDVPPTMTRLLDALEPQCQRAVDELTRLQNSDSSSTSAASSQVQPVVLPDTSTAVEDNSRPGVVPLTTSIGKRLVLLIEWPLELVSHACTRCHTRWRTANAIHTWISYVYNYNACLFSN